MGALGLCAFLQPPPAMTTTTTTKTTIAKTTVTKTKKPPSKRTLQIKRVQVKKNRKAGAKKAASAAKKKGIGLFAPVNLSASLAAICGGKKMPRTEAIKKLWVYIKKNSLNAGHHYSRCQAEGCPSGRQG